MHQHTLDLHPDEADPRHQRLKRIREFLFAGSIAVLLLLNLTGTLKTVAGIDTAAILTLIAGYRTIQNAITGLLQRRISADLAICIAVAAAFWAREYLAAAEAMFIMLIGESLEGYATKRTAAAIRRFVEQMPTRARVLRDGDEVDVDAGSLIEDEVIVVRSGERIAADGIVIQGTSSVDEASITGEPLPRDKQTGDEVFSGTLNLHGFLHVRVTRAGESTTLARVIHLVEEARERKAPVVRLADKWAQYFVPSLLLAAGATWYFTREPVRAVAVLIVGCPCALILATPTAMVAAIGALARRGILVRGGAVLEQAAKIDTVFFDKTGTLTEGRFEIIRLLPADCSESELLGLAAAAESASDHVLGRVIVNESRARSIVVAVPESARVLPGLGAECVTEGRTLRAGSVLFLESNGIAVPTHVLREADEFGATAVMVSDGSRFAGSVLLRDRIREGASEAVHGLGRAGIQRITMLTGDRAKAAEAIARVVHVPGVEAGLLPEAKLTRIRDAVAQGRCVAMIGDGLNDAPALAASHVGIAVSGASDITAEAAGVVYMGRSLEKLPLLVTTARRAVTIVWQNIWIFAVGLNVLAIALAAQGVLGPLQAALTHQAGSFLVMLNSLRLLAPSRRLHLRMPHVDLQPVFAFAWRHRLRFALGAAAALLLSGFYTISPGETGVIERFGRVVAMQMPGLHYKLPWPVESLTRVSLQVRVVELGFRTLAGPNTSEPVTYEWNVTHRGGRFQRLPEESLLLTGDGNMAEVTATVHYRVSDPRAYLFNHTAVEASIRAAAEAALQHAVSTASLDSVLTADRRVVEARAITFVQERMKRSRCGVEILGIRLLDVHPSQETVEAYRAVSASFEEKNRLINEAEGYRNEQVAVARGKRDAELQTAQGYTTGKRNRAAGDALRFENLEGAFRAAPGSTETRLYLETMEQVLPGKRKIIVDRTKGRRHLVLADDGVDIGKIVTQQPAVDNLRPPD